MYLEIEPTGSVELLSIAQASKILGVSTSTMRRLQKARRVPFYNVGRSVRFDRRDLVAYLKKRRVEPLG
jgi:excisionase family DNA binding protein